MVLVQSEMAGHQVAMIVS